MLYILHIISVGGFDDYFTNLIRVGEFSYLSNFFLLALHISEWSEGQVTEYLVATFGDYFTDVKM